MSPEDPSAADRMAAIDAEIGAAWHPGALDPQDPLPVGSSMSSGMAAHVTPLVQLIQKEEAEDEKNDLRKETCTMLLRLMIGNPERKPDLVEIGNTVAVWSYSMGLEPFASMTMEEIADLSGQGRAAVQSRVEAKVEKNLRESGAAVTKSVRQKRKGLSEIYQRGAEGNRNRAKSAHRNLLKSQNTDKPKK